MEKGLGLISNEVSSIITENGYKTRYGQAGSFPHYYHVLYSDGCWTRSSIETIGVVITSEVLKKNWLGKEKKIYEEKLLGAVEISKNNKWTLHVYGNDNAKSLESLANKISEKYDDITITLVLEK